MDPMETLNDPDAPWECAYVARPPGRALVMLPKSAKVTLDLVSEAARHLSPDGQAVVCDCYLEGIERHEPITGGFKTAGGIVNIDHHANDPRMARFISSTNLAIEWVRENGPLASGTPVIINHADCDSVLSAGIMAGILPPYGGFGEAAIAADHTGADNEVADLLQALQPCRDLGFSLRTLDSFLRGEPLADRAIKMLRKRQKERQTFIEMVRTGSIRRVGDVAYLAMRPKLDAALLPAAVPDAKLVMLASVNKEGGGWNVSVRLGSPAIGAYTLHDLDIRSFDPAFGGRWNAGSNSRSGVGTRIPPADYALLLNEKAQAWRQA